MNFVRQVRECAFAAACYALLAVSLGIPHSTEAGVWPGKEWATATAESQGLSVPPSVLRRLTPRDTAGHPAA